MKRLQVWFLGLILASFTAVVVAAAIHGRDADTGNDHIVAVNAAGQLIPALFACEAGSMSSLSLCNTWPGGVPLSLSASGQVKASTGVLVGFFVAQSTSCTVKLWDNTAGSGTVVLDTFTVPAVGWYPLPASFGTGLYFTEGGTCVISFVYK